MSDPTQTQSSKINFSLVVFVVFLIASITILIWQVAKPFSQEVSKTVSDNRQSIDISIVYAPELDPIMQSAINNFNDTFNTGVNPLNGQKLKDGDKKIKVVGQSISSGEARTKIVNSINQSGSKDFTPTIYAPTFSGWLSLVNFESGKPIFDLNNFTSTAKSPVGIAIWENRLKSIQNKNPNKEIGLAEIQQVFDSPNGWKDYDSSINRKQIYFGFTNPQISSTAVSALLTQYYSATSPQSEQLSLSEVKSNQAQKTVQNYQKLIRQYSNNTVVFRDYLGRGPDYIDMLPLAENDLIFVNQGKSQNKPPEKLVMLYPKDGSIVHDYPMVIPEADWVSQEQKDAARSFIEYSLSSDVQQKYLENGLRPANPNVQLGTPITQEFGVDQNQPKKVLKIPTGEVISQIQLNFDFVKKPAKITLLIDTSGSMAGDKIAQAKKALQLFVNKSSAKNEVGLSSFDSSQRVLVQPQSLESSKGQITSGINELIATGGTALYDALVQSTEDFNSSNGQKGVTRAIILLSDGQDTSSSKYKLADVVKKLEESQKSDSPILVLPIAYGGDADLNALNSISRSSKTVVQTGEVKDIEKLLENISSYF